MPLRIADDMASASPWVVELCHHRPCIIRRWRLGVKSRFREAHWVDL